MAKTVDELIDERRKKREEEERNKASSSSNTGKFSVDDIVDKSFLKKSINFDTFESDLADMGNKINEIYGGWQTPETMANTLESVKAMSNRVNDYATYQKKYMPDSTFDVDSLVSGYRNVISDWGNLSKNYSYFKNAEAFNKYPEYITKMEEEAKKREENKAKLDNAFEPYAHYLDKEDYAEKSQYKNTATRDGFWKTIGMDGSDETYEYINDVNDARKMLVAKYKDGNDPVHLETHGYQFMTEDEKGVYNYIYATEGKKSADKYLEDLEISLNKRVYDKSTEEWEKMADSSALASIGMSIASPILNMAGGMGSAIESAKEWATGGKYNPYAPGRVAANASSDIRKYVGENIAESTEGMEVFGQNVPEFLYQTGMSIADSALGASTFGRAFTPIMGMTAYQQKAKELTEAGEDPEVVQKMALSSGVAEALFEYVSIDKLLKIKNVDGVKKAVKSTLAQMGVEGSEEVATELANIFSDVIIRGDGSEVMSQYNDLIARGYSPSEANLEVAKQLGTQVGWAFVGGAISGGVMGGVESGNQYHSLSKMGADIRENDRVSEMMDVAGDGFMSLAEKDAYKLYTEYANKGVTAENISDVQLGNLYANVAQNIDDVSHSKKATPQERSDIERQTKGLSMVNEAKTDAERTREARVKELNIGEVTEVTATGNSAKVEGIKIVDGKTMLQTSEGEFAAEDMTFSQNRAEVLAYAENMGEEKGSLLMAQYDGNTDVESYVNSFEMAYAYGMTGFGSDSVLKNKGVLSEKQASAIYTSAMTYKASAQQKAIDEINQKYSANMEYHGTVDDSAVNYENLTTTQRDAVNFIKSFSQATGVNVRFFESEVVDGKRVGKNGSYNKATNTIEIDVHAGVIDAKTLNDAIIPTMSHEMTHWMKAKAPSMYNNIREHIMNSLVVDGLTSEQRVAAEMKRMQKAHPNQKITEEDAIDEIIARGCEDMLSNSKKAREIMSNLSEEEQKSFIDKVKSTFKNLIDWVNDLLGKYKSKSHEAQVLRQYKENLEKLSGMWDQALTEAIQTNKALVAEGITGEQAISENTFTENTAQLSMRTYENEGRELLHKWLENSDLDEKTRKEIIEQMDYVYDVATKYAEENGLVDFGSWSETDIVRGPDGSPMLSVVVPNGDYPLNIDFSQVCKKRKTLDKVLNALVRAGDLDLRSLSMSDINNINRIIKEHSFEIACGLCFVDSKRYRVNDWADSFTETYNKLVKSLTKGTDLVVDEFNYTGRPVKGAEGRLLKDADDSELNFDYINEVLAKNSSGKAIYRYALAIKNNKDLRSVLRSSEIISSAGLDAIKVQNRTLYDLVNSHQGSAKPKLSHGEVPYAYDILLQKKFNAEDAYKVGGVRMQSFSDYMANMFFDYVQMIGDLSAKQLPAHAYTKEYYFAKLFGLTGIKINLSVVPKGADITDEQKARFNKMTKAAKEKDPEFKELKSHAGLDAEGNYILEDETFPLDKALELQNTKGYDKNCGIIWVGVSKKHIEKMLDDPNVPYIIPYHKSSLNPHIARMRNIDFYNDYTKAQNTRYDTKAKKKVPASIWSFDFYGDLANTNDPKTTAANYIKECRDRGYLPKFDEFAEHPNYYKLLVDFRVYDNEGNYAPQGAVQMKFPDNFNEIVGESLREAQDTSARLDASMEGLLSEIRKELKIGQEQLSDRDYYSPTFYSHMGKVIDEIKTNKMSADGVVNYLRGKGVKAEEIKWSGIEAFLEGKKSVTKEELKEFAAGSTLQIEEKMNEGGPEVTLEYSQYGDDSLDVMVGSEVLDTYSWNEYKEVYVSDTTGIGFRTKDRILEFYKKKYDRGNTKWKQYTLKGGSNYRELLFKMPNSEYSNTSMKAHWEQSGVLAHARMQDVKTDDGEKMLFIEEIQSDWHNEGKKKGYRGKGIENISQYNKRCEEFVKKSVDDEFGEGTYEKVFDWAFSPLTFAETTKVEEFAEKMEEEFKARNPKPDHSTKYLADDAPFKNNYHEYVMKRLLRMAAEEGYDSIGWTTSDIQADRWSEAYLEGYRIEYDQDIPKFMNKYGKKWGGKVDRTTLQSGEEVWHFTIPESMKDSVLYEGQAQFSDRVTEDDEYIANGKNYGNALDYLKDKLINGVEGKDFITVYRSFQVINGGLYAPMNAVDRDDDGKNHRLGFRSRIGVIEKATESPAIAQAYMDKHPDAPYAKFNLDGVDNATSGVAYNPYLHASNLVMNDQFSAAYRRNLVTVECRVPVSEIGAYHAQYAKDPTGWVEWKPGGTSLKLAKAKPQYTRKLFVSRYMLPYRILDYSDVANMYKEYLDGTNIKVPWNVVGSDLREALLDVGVGVDYKDYVVKNKNYGDKVYKYNEHKDDSHLDLRTIEGFSENAHDAKQNISKNLTPGETENTIYIKDGHTKDGKTVNFIDLILDGKKKGETRSHKSLTRKWVGIAKDGLVYGRVRFGDPIEITNKSPEYKDAYIEGTEYGLKDGETKYYYPVLEIEDMRDNPRSITRHGNYGQYQYADRYEDAFFDLFDTDGSMAASSAIIEEDVNRFEERRSMGEIKFDDSQAKAIAKYLREKVNSGYDVNALMDDLKDVYGYIKNTTSLDANALMAKCYDVARRILNGNKDQKVTGDYAKMVLKDIRNARLKLSDDQMKALKGRYGESYHTAIFGRINVSNKDSIALDTKWAEWSAQYPEIFDANISSENMITELDDVYKALKMTTDKKHQFEESLAAMSLGAEIYNQMWLRTTVDVKSESDKKKLKELNFAHRKAIDNVRGNLVDKQIESAQVVQIMNNIKAQSKRDVDRAKQLGKDRMDKYKENVEKRAKIEKISRNALDMNKWLKTNSADAHIPDAMQPVVAHLLNAIDFSSKQYLRTGEMTKRDESLHKALTDLQNYVKSTRVSMDSIYALYGDDLDEKVAKAVEAADNAMRTVGDNHFILNQMTLDELDTLDKVVASVKVAVTKMNKFHKVHHKKGIINLCHTFMLHAEKYGQIKLHKHGNAALFTLNWANALPKFVMNRFGEAGNKIFTALMDGQDKLAYNAETIMKFAKETFSKEEMEKWSEDVREIEINLPNGQKKKIQIPVAHIMSLYCLSKREHALGHLLGGGIRIMDFEGKKGIVSQGDGVLLMESELEKILSELDDRQREVAKKLQEFMNTVCSDWGNEVSMARFGYKAFLEKFYFPITSDKRLTGKGEVKDVEKSLYRLLNMSLAKPLVENANNRIEVDNIFDTFAKHTSEMAKYNAMALPVLDAVRWFAYNEKGEKIGTQFETVSVMEKMETAYGKDAVNYVRTLLEDINSADNVGRDRLSKGFMSRAKIAAVGFNLKVAALQPTSYLRALTVIDGKYLRKALLHKPNTKMAEKWCGMAKWKSFGFRDINIQRGLTDLIKQNKDTLAEISMKGAEIMDEITMGYLWNACELEVKEKRSDLKVGSDEFYKEVGLRLRDIIYSTQVVDSTLTRSEMMRSPDRMDKFLTNFAAEPTLSYNLLLDCAYNWYLTKRETGSNTKAFKEHGGKFVTTMYAYTLTSAVTALLETGFAMFRDDDEEKDEEEIIKMYLENFYMNMSVANKLPWVKELMSIAQGFTSSSMDTQWASYLVSALREALKVVEGKGDAYKMTKKALQGASYLSGIPGYNFLRDAKALWNHIVGSMFPSMKIDTK